VIVPCIDLMDGKVVQLVQGRDKALEVDSADEMLNKFAAFPEIQVIDLDAAMGKGSNDILVAHIASRAKCRIGGGVRSAERARLLVAQGAVKVIVGTAAFDQAVLSAIVSAIGRDHLMIALDSKGGKVVVQGWRESTGACAEELLPQLAPYCSGFLCTFVDKEGMLEGTDLEWFRRLRAVTTLPITAAGGITTMEEIRALQAMHIDAAVGMAVYTGRLDLADLVATM
jgi:phosphoribosylformimino-5-aminoimidazole carboxamide ribotide isomerase